MWFVAVVLAGIGPEAPVATLGAPVDAPSFMYHPDVASDGDGGFFAVWADKRFTGDTAAIVATRVLSDGGVVDPRGLVVSRLFGTTPRVRFIGGQWVVVWESFGDTWVRAVTPGGTFTGPEQRVGVGGCPDLRARGDGGVTIVTGGGWRGGFLRRYGPGLVPIEPQASSFTSDDVSCPRIAGPLIVFDAPLPDGGPAATAIELDTSDQPMGSRRVPGGRPVSAPLAMGTSVDSVFFLAVSGASELVATNALGVRSLVLSQPAQPVGALVEVPGAGVGALAYGPSGGLAIVANTPSSPWGMPLALTGLNGFHLAVAAGPSSALAMANGGAAQWLNGSFAPVGTGFQMSQPLAYHETPSVAVAPSTSLTAWRERVPSFSAIRAAVGGQAPVTLSPGGAGWNDCPSVAFDGAQFGVAWRRGSAIEFRTVSTTGVLGPTLLLEPMASTCPRLLVSGGTFHVTFGRAADVVVTAWNSDGGATHRWAASTAATPQTVHAALDDAGAGYVVWSERLPNDEIRVAGAHRLGPAVTPFLICPSGPCEKPLVALDGRGGGLVTSLGYFTGLSVQRLTGATASAPVQLHPSAASQSMLAVREGALVAAAEPQTGRVVLWQVSPDGPGLDAGAPIELVPAGRFGLLPSLAGLPLTLVTIQPDSSGSMPQAFRRTWTPDVLGASCLGGWACASGTCVRGTCVLPPSDAGMLDAGVTEPDGGSAMDAGVPASDAGSGDGGPLDAGAPAPDAGGAAFDAGAADGGTADASVDVDGGVARPDAGSGDVDGGPVAASPDAGDEPRGEARWSVGCDCQSGAGPGGGALVFALIAIRRRRA
jgi:hypothetical protein